MGGMSNNQLGGHLIELVDRIGEYEHQEQVTEYRETRWVTRTSPLYRVARCVLCGTERTDLPRLSGERFEFLGWSMNKDQYQSAFVGVRRDRYKRTSEDGVETETLSDPVGWNVGFGDYESALMRACDPGQELERTVRGIANALTVGNVQEYRRTTLAFLEMEAKLPGGALAHLKTLADSYTALARIGG